MKNNVYIALSASNAWYGKELRNVMYEDQISSVPKNERVNHSFIVYESSDWKDWRAVDIQEKGVQPTIPVKDLTRVDYVECWQVPKVDLWKGIRACKNDLFKRYDWKGLIFGILRLKLMSWFGMKLTKPHHASNRLFCSEYIAKVLKKSGAPSTEHWAPANISPKDLQDYFLEHGQKVALPTPLAELIEKVE